MRPRKTIAQHDLDDAETVDYRDQYNSKKGGRATTEGLAMSLQAAAKGMDTRTILTSHGSPAGLCHQSGAAYANAHAV